MKRFLFFVLCIGLLSIGCASNQRHTPVVPRPENVSLQKHIVRISIARKTGTYSCTGVFVSESGIIATARHCVEHQAKYHVLTSKGWEPAGVLRVDLKNDIALMHIKGWDWEPMPICKSMIDVDARVCAVGMVLSTGETEWECGTVTSPGNWKIITNTAVRPGFSGGPLIDIDRQCLAGITYAHMLHRHHNPRALHVGLGPLKDLINLFE